MTLREHLTREKVTGYAIWRWARGERGFEGEDGLERALALAAADAEREALPFADDGASPTSPPLPTPPMSPISPSSPVPEATGAALDAAGDQAWHAKMLRDSVEIAGRRAMKLETLLGATMDAMTVGEADATDTSDDCGATNGITGRVSGTTGTAATVPTTVPAAQRVEPKTRRLINTLLGPGASKLGLVDVFLRTSSLAGGCERLMVRGVSLHRVVVGLPLTGTGRTVGGGSGLAAGRTGVAGRLGGRATVRAPGSATGCTAGGGVTVLADAPDWARVLANNNLLSRDPMPPPVVPEDYADPANLPMSSMNYAWIGEDGTVRVSGVGAARVMAAWEDGHAATSGPDGSLDLPAAYKSADFEPTVYENGEYMKVSVWQARLAAQEGAAGEAGAAWTGDVTEGLGPGEAWSTTTWPVTVVLRSVPKPEDWRSGSRPWLRSSLPNAAATAKRPFAGCTAESADGGDDDAGAEGDEAGDRAGTGAQARRVLALQELRDAERRQASAAEKERLVAEQERRREKEAEFQAWNAEQRAQKARRRCLSY